MDNDALECARGSWHFRGKVRPAAAVQPAPGQESVWDHLAFYPDRLECYVDGKRVRAQRGGFYGGWITDDIVGPFKGEPGTEGW